MGKTLAESSEELDAALRAAGSVLGTAIAETRPFRWFVRFAAWADAKVPALRWLDDHAPPWLRFPSWAFFEMVGAIYLGVAIGYLIWYFIIR